MELNEFLKQCEDDDVLCWEEKLFKIKQIQNAIKLTFGNPKIINLIFDYFKQYGMHIHDHNWFINGVSGSILKSGSKGWQKGKLKIKVVLEFELDEPEQSQSPLDEVRQEITNNE